jgi:hypothetical protein
MIVWRLQIAAHPLLQQLAEFLACVPRPELFISTPTTERGDWRADVDGPPPVDDRPQPFAFRRLRMQTPLQLPGMNGDTMISALNYFPVGGGGLGWHTDTGHPGWRVYMPRLLSPAPGVFRTPAIDYVDNEKLALAFYVSGDPADSWHAVRSEGGRFSLGVRFADGPTQRQLGLSR